MAPPVTATTNPTNLRVMETKPHMHLWAMRDNTSGTTLTILMTTLKDRHSTRLNLDIMVVEEATTPNSNRIPSWHPNMILHEANNLVTENTYYGTNMDIWTPDVFLTADILLSHVTLNYDADIDHLCAPVVHPDTGETITSYKKIT